MRTHALIVVLACGFSVPVNAAAPPVGSEADAIYKELHSKLTGKGIQAKTARLELEYWRGNRHNSLFPTPKRIAVRTKDGKNAEVILLEVRTLSMPAEEFSAAFLLVGGRVIDSASCWTYNRTADQKVLLEDVDGDGSLDIAFRAGPGFWGLLDTRQHRRSEDDRTWLYAYTITSKGLQSLFPITDKMLRVRLKQAPGGGIVRLRVEGVPQSVREYQLFEVRVSATSTSRCNLKMAQGGWFELGVEGANSSVKSLTEHDCCNDLKPGSTVTQLFWVYLFGQQDKEITLRCIFKSH